MTGQIINLHGDPHRDVMALLPWHVTGQLDADDAARVEAHLDGCAACRDAVEHERQFERAVVRVPASVDEGWAVMRQRLELDAPAMSRRSSPVPASRRPLAPSWRDWLTGWRLGAPLALASLLGVVVMTGLMPARFTALGSPPAAATGNVVVIFRPETTEALFRQTLRMSEARLVDGPTAANAYVLEVPMAQRTAMLDRLRHQSQVVLAEPVDAAARP